MTLLWIGNIVLLVVVFPLVVYLLNGVLQAAQGDRPDRRGHRGDRRGGLQRPRRRPRCC